MLRHQSQINSVAFSPDGKVLASGASEADLVIWDVKAGRQRVVKKLAKGFVDATTFSRDGKTLVASVGSNIIFFRTTNWSEEKRLQYKDRVYWSQSISPDNKWLASCATMGWEEILIWDFLQKTESVPRYILHPEKSSDSKRNPFNDAAISPDGTLLAAVNRDSVHLWRIPEFDQKPMILKGNRLPLQVLAFSPDGKFLATCGNTGADGELIIWSVPRLGK